MSIGLDVYTRNARLKPALLTVLPAAWTVMAWSPEHALGWGGLWAMIVAAGGTALLAHIARDRGKRNEQKLFDKFGGRPTERLLSHTHAPNAALLARQHAKLRMLLPDVHIPSADDERRDPDAAHQAYAACTKSLIARNRENKLVFEENVNFGFRRNLWGLRPHGIAIAGGAVVVLGLRLFMEFSGHLPVSPLIVGFEVLNIAMFFMWAALVTPEWVMLPARAYAERLLETLEIS